MPSDLIERAIEMVFTERIGVTKVGVNEGRNASEENMRRYQALKSKYQNLLRKSKYTAQKRFVSIDMNVDPFKNLKKLASEQSSNQFPDELIVNGNKVTDKMEIMSELSKSFFVAPKPIEEKQQGYIDAYQNYLSNTIEPEPPPITRREVEDVIFVLKKNSAPGQEDISIELIQVAIEILADLLTVLFNSCINIGHYLTKWKYIISICKNF